MSRNQSVRNSTTSLSPFSRDFVMDLKLPLPGSFQEHFASLEDPRVTRTQEYALIPLLFMAFTSVLAGCSGWDAMALFAKTKRAWFCNWFDLPHGTPCADTFRRIFQSLAPKPFALSFNSWLTQLRKHLPGELLAIDGKSLKGAVEAASPSVPLHLLHVWATQQKTLIAHQAVAGAPGENRGLALLLQNLLVSGCLLATDANGCTYKNAALIVEKEADYLFGLKGNRGSIHKATKKLFAEENEHKKLEHSEADKGHGRIEERKTMVLGAEALPPEILKKWKGLRSLICVERRRTRGTKIGEETHYYLSSIAPDAARLAKEIREYWSVENQLHWVLDVTMGEDTCRVKDLTSAENLGTLRRQALALLNHPNAGKMSIAMKQRCAGWDEQYLTKLLCLSTISTQNP